VINAWASKNEIVRFVDLIAGSFESGGIIAISRRISSSNKCPFQIGAIWIGP
jgi:hypothetical protein